MGVSKLYRDYDLEIFVLWLFRGVIQLGVIQLRLAFIIFAVLHCFLKLFE